MKVSDSNDVVLLGTKFEVKYNVIGYGVGSSIVVGILKS